MSAHAPDDKLLDLLYGELPPEEARALRAELDADPERRATYEELRASRELIAQHTSQPARVPSALTDRILEDARTHAPSPTRSAPDPRQSLWRRAWHSPGFRQSLVAAALLVGVAGILRALQLDTAPRSHDPLAEHGMAAPVSFETSTPEPTESAESAEQEATPADDEVAPPAEHATSEGATSEAADAIKAESPASTRAKSAGPQQAREGAASIVTTDQPPARAAEPRPGREPRASRRAEASDTSMTDLSTGSAPRARQRAASAPTAAGRGLRSGAGIGGNGGIGANTAPEAPREHDDAFARAEDRRDAAPMRERAEAPSEELAPLATSEGTALKRRAASPSAANALADGEAAPSSAEAEVADELAAPPLSPLQRARQARANNDADATLTLATSALSSERSPRARAEAYALIAWAHTQLGDDEAAQQALDQQASILRELDASTP
ncbi:hypothetical protein FRC96_01740 [Lujinxingia vulgaris]|uniref:Zinc-finger domain-containing protein n=1 Tax=Lujinxingia vulgaris TaxID=2600176 RepID=A0A5C6XLR5_9DELT|nr:hypothetical protein [Lujinxingia vulgaris]TXD43311.1 hypothetical protein FRC96_01740 [Lujinxingia vulgaris]